MVGIVGTLITPAASGGKFVSFEIGWVGQLR